MGYNVEVKVGDGDSIRREFDTKAERTAFLEGLREGTNHTDVAMTRFDNTEPVVKPEDFVVTQLEVHEQPVLIRAEDAGTPEEAVGLVKEGQGHYLSVEGIPTYHTRLDSYAGVDTYWNVERKGQVVASVDVDNA